MLDPRTGEYACIVLGQSVSDAVRRMKVSRQGLALIKSFEGFRPRARMVGGRWMIGYGHTASARDGAEVTEADAELLLQYDLAPIAKALNAFPANLNQNQFDALASFALSLGAERFVGSETARRLAAGDADAVSESLFAHPWSPHADAGLNRRAAERALFGADPAAPPSLELLLRAPLEAFPAQSKAKARAAAVAALLGEGDLAPFPVSSEPESEGEEWTTPLETEAPSASEPVSADDPAPLLAPPAVDPEPAPDAPAVEADPPRARPVIRHEVVQVMPQRFDWSETGMYLIMGFLGLLACAFAAAATRLTLLRPEAGGESGAIAWALAIIGVMCVGVSAWNLYTVWDRRR